MDSGNGSDLMGLISAGLSALSYILFVLFYILSLVWAFFDAERRGKSGCLVVLLIALLFWPISLLFWLVARPNRRR